MKTKDRGPFSKAKAEQLMNKVALGVDWLHSHNIIHRDFKASNVLYDDYEYEYGYYCFTADSYEFSIGVARTRFFKAHA